MLRNSIPLRVSTQKGSFLMRGIYNAVFLWAQYTVCNCPLTKQSQLFFLTQLKYKVIIAECCHNTVGHYHKHWAFLDQIPPQQRCVTCNIPTEVKSHTHYQAKWADTCTCMCIRKKSKYYFPFLIYMHAICSHSRAELRNTKHVGRQLKARRHFFTVLCNM